MINVKSGATVKKVLLAIVAVLGLGTVAPVTAAPITGTMAITGAVRVSLTTIDWIPYGLAGEEGVVSTVDGTDYFSGIYNPAGSPNFEATSLDLVAAPPVVGFLRDFTAPGYAALSFDLYGVDLPNAALPACTAAFVAVDVSCRFNAFTLTNRIANGQNVVDVQFDVFGAFLDPIYEGAGTPLNTAIGAYTATLSATASNTISEVVTIINGGGAIQTGFDGSYTATPVGTEVPEPATMLTFGLGTAVLAAHRRRRAKKNASI